MNKIGKADRIVRLVPPKRKQFEVEVLYIGCPNINYFITTLLVLIFVIFARQYLRGFIFAIWPKRTLKTFKSVKKYVSWVFNFAIFFRILKIAKLRPAKLGKLPI